MQGEEIEVKKPEINETDFLKNPLLAADFEVKVKVIKDGSFVSDRSGAALPKEVDFEYETYFKGYNNRENRLSVALMSPRAQRLYLWIMFEAEPGKDWLWINVKRYMKENQIEDMKTYRAAVKELCRYMVIALVHGYKNVFWFNPRFFFCGSRLNKYPDHVRYVTPSRKQAAQPAEQVAGQPAEGPQEIEQPDQPSEYRV